MVVIIMMIILPLLVYYISHAAPNSLLLAHSYIYIYTAPITVPLNPMIPTLLLHSACILIDGWFSIDLTDMKQAKAQPNNQLIFDFPPQAHEDKLHIPGYYYMLMFLVLLCASVLI